MLAALQERAAAIGEMLRSPGVKAHIGAQLFDAVLDCSERLADWADADSAIALIDAALAEGEAYSPRQQLRLKAQRLRVLAVMHRDHEALEETQRLLQLHMGQQNDLGDEYTFLRVLEGHVLWHLNRTEEAIGKLTRLRLELFSRPDSEHHARCLSLLASAYISEGRWDQAREFSLECWVSARRIGSPYLQGVALGNLCIAERARCRWASSEDAGRDSIAMFEQAGARLRASHVRRSLAITQWKRGHLAEAASTASEIQLVATTLSHKVHARYAILLRSLIHLHTGAVEEATAALLQVADPAACVKESRPELLRLEYLGDVELEQGHAEAALKRYDEVLPHALALIPRGDVVAEIRRRRAECYLLLGRAQEAYDEAKGALELCLELGDRYEEAATYRTIALAAADLGKHDEAKKHFVHGFAMYDDIETPYEWGKLWMSYGDWLCGAHAGAYESLSGACEAYRAACDHFEHMGAELKLTHARDRMAKLEQRLRDEGILEPAASEKPRPRRRPSLDRELQRRVQWAHDTFALVTRHRPLIEMLEQIATVAVSDIPVLVLGESGTGKELIARGVHSLSGRTGSLVEVNCSAVPATMMEAEFFGSIHGSYTGSTRDRAGLFEEAHEGSVFLDEIGDMPVDLQSKLLRFLETGEVRRIGANIGRRVDARLIAATNRDSAKLQSGDGFRHDLYYRLAHAVFTLPPLRSRGDDTALLVDHFLDRFSSEARKRVTLSGAARERVFAYAWPGNVRQLRALIQRLVVQSADGHVVTPREIPLAEAGDAPRNFVEEMEGQEKVRIVEALEKSRFIKADAARLLRMSRTTLLGKMKRYGIPG